MFFPALASFILRSALVLGIAAAARRLLRTRVSAAARYRMVFLVAAGLPLMAAATFLEIRGAGLTETPIFRKTEAAAFSADPAPRPPAAAGGILPVRVPRRLALALVATWAAVGLFRLGSAAAARVEAARALRRLPPCRDPAWRTALEAAASRIGLRRPIRLLDGGELPPFTAGWLGRTVVVPAEVEDWTAEKREAVLLHEAAHVRRRDVVRMTYVDFLASAVWCVPFLPSLLRALAEDREEACDEEALAAGAKPSEYAAALLELTAALPPGPPRWALGMSRTTKIEARIRRIIVRPGRRRAPLLVGRAATIALLLIGLLVGGTGSLTKVFALQDGPGAAAGADLPKASPLVGDWKVTQRFGPSVNPVTGKPYRHVGLDLANGRSGDPVAATIAGTVVEAGYDEGSGNHVAVGRGRVLVRFSKLAAIKVAVGDSVRIGETIGTVGATGIATGPHLHYEIWVDGIAVDPAEPLRAGGARFGGLAGE